MKNEIRDGFGATTLFTIAALEALKDKGYRYVQIKGFTADKKLDYMEPRYWVLIPMKELPAGKGEIEIYEPINSQTLVEWATHPHDGMKVLVCNNKKP
jgi:hypothetical protein